jgi:hypothetical protein
MAGKDKRKFPLASLIILNWNGKRFLKDCLGTLLRQDYPNFEVVFCDNGSTDDSVEYVRKNFSSVKVVENKKNLGFSVGINPGIRAAKGEYVVILNNDMIFHRRDCISELVKAAESDKRIGVVGAMFLDAREPKKIQEMELKFPRVMDFLGWFSKKEEYEEDHGQYKELIEVEACNGLTKREVFDKVGLYDEGYFFTYEELDFCYRARQAGYRVVINPRAKLWHVGRGTSRLVFFKSQYYAYKGRLRFAMKHFKGLRKIVFIAVNIVAVPLLVLRDACEIASRKLSGKNPG